MEQRVRSRKRGLYAAYYMNLNGTHWKLSKALQERFRRGTQVRLGTVSKNRARARVNSEKSNTHLVLTENSVMANAKNLSELRGVYLAGDF